MLALETKQSRGKVLTHSDPRGGGGVFPGVASRSRQRGMKIGILKFRCLYRAWSLKAAVKELVRYKLGVVDAGGQVGQRGHRKSRGL